MAPAKKPAVTRIVAQSGVTVEEADILPEPGGMVVTSEKLGPPIEESFLPEAERPKPPAEDRNLVRDLERSLGAAAGEEPSEEEQAEAARRDLSERVQALSLPDGFAKVVTYQFEGLDEAAEYRELRLALTFGDSAAFRLQHFGELALALEKAEDQAYRAAVLVASYKVKLTRFESDVASLEGAMRQAALAVLTAEKEALKKRTGLAGKALAAADVVGEAARAFPDEWAVLKRKEAEARESVKLAEYLRDRWAERARDLRALVSNSRAVG